MKTTRYRNIVLVLALLFGIQTLASARAFSDKPYARAGLRGPRQAMMLRRVIRRLDLTDEQTEKVKTIVKNNKGKAEAAEKAAEQARNLVHKAVIKGAGETEVKTAAASLGTALTNQAINKAATMASIRAILTEQQLKELDKLGVDRKGPHGRFQRGMGRGHGRQGFQGQEGRWQKGGRGYGRGDFGGGRRQRSGRGYGRDDFGGRQWQKGGPEYGGRNFRGRDFDGPRQRGYRGRGQWHQDEDDD